MSDSLQPHALYTRLRYSPLTPRVCSNWYPLSWWCYLTILSSSFSFYLPSFPASGSFPVSWLFTSGGQSTAASASVSVLPMSIHGWFTLRLTSSILQSKGLSSTTVWKYHFFSTQRSQPYMTTGRTIALTVRTSVGKVMSLLLNTLSRFFIAFLPRSNRL